MPKYSKESALLNEHILKRTLSKWRCTTEDGSRGLSTFLGKVEKGQPNVYTTPFAKGESTSDMLDAWSKELEVLRDEWPTLLEFEEDLRSKVGPMSVMLPIEERMDDIAHYYVDILRPARPISDEAVHAVLEEWKAINSLSLRSKERTMENMKKSSNSGVPFWTKRRNVIPETLRSEVYKFNPKNPITLMDFSRDDMGEFTAAAVVGWRGQEGGPKEDDIKQRVVWMFPFAVNLEELRVYQPLIEAAQTTNLVPAWVSMGAVDKEITALFDTKSKDDLIICTDFSKFDQHFNEKMQKCARTILYQLVDKGDKDKKYWFENIFPIKYDIPLIFSAANTSKGEPGFRCFMGKHGMGSGSGGTNADETLAHRALQHEVAITHGQKLNLHSMCLGDDGILTYPGITVDDVVQAYESHGQECNISKQYASTQECIYLRRWHHINYRIDGVCAGVYSTYRALGRMRYLERFMDPEVWSPEAVELRWLSILENTNNHPLFEQFVQFCMKRDKYRLGLDLPGFLDHLAHYVVEAIDIMPEFLGYTKTLQNFTASGINDWRVVKYLRSLK